MSALLRIGIAGAGRIVERAHLPILAAAPWAEVTALYDPDGARAESLAAAHRGLRACRTLEELLAADLDVVLVASPNALHGRTAVAALEAGRHVMCEKPMATSAAEARAMVRAAERAGRELMVAFPNRFRPEVRALENAVAAGALGRIHTLRASWLRRSGVPGLGTWFTRRALAGGGALTDLGSHLVDLAVWLAGGSPVSRASCSLDRDLGRRAEAAWYQAPDAGTPAECDVETGARGHVRLESGVHLFLEVAWASRVPRDRTRLRVAGSRGEARLATLFGMSPDGERPRRPLRIRTDVAGFSDDVEGSPDLLQPYRDQWEHFAARLAAGESLRPWLRQASAGVEIVEALYRSTSTVNRNLEEAA